MKYKINKKNKTQKIFLKNIKSKLNYKNNNKTKKKNKNKKIIYKNTKYGGANSTANLTNKHKKITGYFTNLWTNICKATKVCTNLAGQTQEMVSNLTQGVTDGTYLKIVNEYKELIYTIIKLPAFSSVTNNNNTKDVYAEVLIQYMKTFNVVKFDINLYDSNSSNNSSNNSDNRAYFKKFVDNFYENQGHNFFNLYRYKKDDSTLTNIQKIILSLYLTKNYSNITNITNNDNISKILKYLPYLDHIFKFGGSSDHEDYFTSLAERLKKSLETNNFNFIDDLDKLLSIFYYIINSNQENTLFDTINNHLQIIYIFYRQHNNSKYPGYIPKSTSTPPFDTNAIAWQNKNNFIISTLYTILQSSELLRNKLLEKYITFLPIDLLKKYIFDLIERDVNNVTNVTQKRAINIQSIIKQHIRNIINSKLDENNLEFIHLGIFYDLLEDKNINNQSGGGGFFNKLIKKVSKVIPNKVKNNKISHNEASKPKTWKDNPIYNINSIQSIIDNTNLFILPHIISTISINLSTEQKQTDFLNLYNKLFSTIYGKNCKSNSEGNVGDTPQEQTKIADIIKASTIISIIGGIGLKDICSLIQSQSQSTNTNKNQIISLKFDEFIGNLLINNNVDIKLKVGFLKLFNLQSLDISKLKPIIRKTFLHYIILENIKEYLINKNKEEEENKNEVFYDAEEENKNEVFYDAKQIIDIDPSYQKWNENLDISIINRQVDLQKLSHNKKYEVKTISSFFTDNNTINDNNKELFKKLFHWLSYSWWNNTPNQLNILLTIINPEPQETPETTETFFKQIFKYRYPISSQIIQLFIGFEINNDNLMESIETKTFLDLYNIKR